MGLEILPEAQIFIMFPKAVEAITFVVIALIIKNREGKAFNEQYLLNRTLVIGFFAWAQFITLDLFIFILAPQSFDPSIATGTVTGYNTAYPSLLIANILRDLSIFGGYIFIWSIFSSAYIILHGEEQTRRRFLKNPLFVFGLVAYGLFFIFTDEIYVQIRPGQDTVVNAVFSDISLITLTITITIYVLSALFFRKAASTGIYASTPKLKQRIKLLSWGALLLAIILVYWLVKGILEMLPGIGQVVLSLNILLEIIGHGVWSLAPILMYISLREPLPASDSSPAT